jgi:hypothetical protein
MGNMEWINVKDQLPSSEYRNKDIFILVNGMPQVAHVMVPECGYLPRDSFLFCTVQKRWVSDPRFAEPTHWMPMPKMANSRMTRAVMD